MDPTDRLNYSFCPFRRPIISRLGRKCCKHRRQQVASATFASLQILLSTLALHQSCMVTVIWAQYVQPVPPPELPIRPPVIPLQPTPGQMITVPGSALTRQQQDQIVRQIILPYENFRPNASHVLAVSNVIDQKRFVEAVSSRCFSSTVMDDPMVYEPSFVIVTPTAESRVNATAPASHILAAGYNPQIGTTIIIHGFTQSYPSTDWLRHSRALFEKHHLVGKHNFIIMDWGSASHGSYSQVAARVSVVSDFLANFLMKLVNELGADRMNVHIIGHSLGAHVAGFAGKRIRPRLGRITALDPAGPCFGKFFSNSPSDRLSPDDAYEVDVYHYDDGFLGLPGQIGQFDILVNGGSSQPGCKDNVYSMFNALVTVVFRRNRVLSESHTRSTEVATSQLSMTGCQQMAYECRDFNAFSMGECGKCDQNNNQCFFMGLPYQYAGPDSHVNPLRTSFPGKRFYISTGKNELFCANHYQLLIKFEPTPEMATQAKRNKWRLQVELLNDSINRTNVTVSNLMAPNIFSYLLLTEAQPMRIVGATIRAIASDNSVVNIQPASGDPHAKPHGFKLTSMEVNFMSHIDPLARRALSSRLCPAPNWSRNDQDLNSIAESSWVPQDGLPMIECSMP